ncbi:hypothetical protein ACNPQM_01755 [Streptomyces sp. NPDC056231]|uniref:hypothetical protein n=1 Tax=Streptomyces sp. NPDC056231 TaxID=3345755 RepID=UPI003AAB4F97
MRDAVEGEQRRFGERANSTHANHGAPVERTFVALERWRVLNTARIALEAAGPAQPRQRDLDGQSTFRGHRTAPTALFLPRPAPVPRDAQPCRSHALLVRSPERFHGLLVIAVDPVDGDRSGCRRSSGWSWRSAYQWATMDLPAPV